MNVVSHDNTKENLILIAGDFNFDANFYEKNRKSKPLIFQQSYRQKKIV